MKSCWAQIPDDRPVFKDVIETLEIMMTRENPYFELLATTQAGKDYDIPKLLDHGEETTDGGTETNV